MQIQMSSVRPDIKIINCWEGKIYPLIFLPFSPLKKFTSRRPGFKLLLARFVTLDKLLNF